MANGNCATCSRPLDGRHPTYCKACAAQYARQNRVAGGEARRTYSREYRRAYMAKYPEKRAQYARKAYYGLTHQEFLDLMERQQGLCAICEVVLEEGRGKDKLAVDHDHVTGVIRGLLCQQCNSGLGYFRDNPLILQAAIAYLARVPQQAEGTALNPVQSEFESPVGHSTLWAMPSTFRKEV